MMGLSVKDILKLGGMIAATGLTGGTAAALAPALGFGAQMLGGEKDDDDDDERDWKLAKIQEWMATSRRLMDAPMRPEVKAETMKGKLRSDFIQHYGDIPKERWVENIHSMIVMAVKGDMAVAVSRS